MEKSLEYVKARETAIKYIVFKSRTSFETKEKLIKSGYNEEIADKVVSDLIQSDYINDERYLKNFIENTKKNKKESKIMIKLKLKKKGINEEVTEKYLETSKYCEIPIIIKLLAKKKFLECDDFEIQNKIKNYCLRKGFSMKDIIEAIKRLEKGDNYDN